MREVAGGGLEQAESAGKSDLPLYMMSVYAGVPRASKGTIEAGLSGLVSYNVLQVEVEDHATFRGALPDGCGVSVLAGTGSFAIGRSPDGIAFNLCLLRYQKRLRFSHPGIPCLEADHYRPWILILPIPPFTSRSTRFSAVLKSGEMYSSLIRV